MASGNKKGKTAGVRPARQQPSGTAARGLFWPELYACRQLPVELMPFLLYQEVTPSSLESQIATIIKNLIN